MKSLKELREMLAALLEKMAALHESAEKENRSFTEAENTEWKGLAEQRESLKVRIKRAEELDADKKAAAKIAYKKDSEETKIKKRYSFLKAIRSQLPNEKLTGLELEMHQEAEKEVREAGETLKGVGVPKMFFKPMHKRDLEVATATAGGNTVATELGPMIDALRPRMRVMELGAQVLSNLTGNFSYTKLTGLSTATWATEKASATETTPTTGTVAMTPKRLAAYTEYTMQLLRQSSVDVEMLVRTELEQAVQKAVDLAAINGSGSGAEPTGILQATDIGTVAIATDGGAPTRTHLVNLIGEIANDNADIDTLAYLTTPGVKTKLMNTLLDSGSGRFVWEMPNELLGYRAAISTQVPSDLTKGAGTNLHAIILGVWNQLIIASWAGLDIIVNPYTLAKTGKIEVVTNSFWDIGIRHDESFSVVVDADVS